MLFKKNLGLLFSARENVLNKFKRRLFPIRNLDKIQLYEPARPEPATELTKNNKSILKFQQEFTNEFVAGKKYADDGIFQNYFNYKNPSFLGKALISATQTKNKQLVKKFNGGLIDLRNAIITKQIPGNENPKKINSIVDIVEKFLNSINTKKLEDVFRT